jgi:hypothetical protein
MYSTEHLGEAIHDNVLEVDLHGRLTRADYEWFGAEADKLIARHGKIRILITVHDFEGWEASAVWQDIKWNVLHFHQVERLAIVGGKVIEGAERVGAFEIQYRRRVHWHKWVTNLLKPFTNTDVRYYGLEELEQARAWVNER